MSTELNSNIYKRLQKDSKILYLCLLAPLILCFPSLFVGLVGDDYYHKAVLTNSLPYESHALLDLFTFFSGISEKNQYLIDIGVLSWWSEPDILASFMRPISSLSHVVDYMLWPNQIFMHHIHSILWMSACIWMVHQVFLLLLPQQSPWITSLGLLIFAVEDAHVMATSWLANRNSCIAFFFAMLCLKNHILWCKDKPSALYKSPIYFGMALLSGESGLCIWGYILAYNYIFLAKETPWQKIQKNLPYVILILIWRILYRSVGFGTFGSSLYIDPLQSPFLFIEEFLFRAPVLFASLYLQIPAEFGLIIPPFAQTIVQICSVSFFILCAYWMYLQKNKNLSFFFLGSVFSIVPLCGAFPMERLLMFPSLGFAAIIALLLHSNPSKLTMGLLFLHLPLAIVLHVGKGGSLFFMKHVFETGFHAIPKEIKPTQSIFFLNGMELPCAYTTILSFNKEISFQGISMLSSSSKPATLTRINDTDFLLSYEEGMFEETFDRMTLNNNHVFEKNRTIFRKNFQVTILDTINGEPSQVQFHIPKGIDHPDFIWLSQKGLEFLPFSFPPPNQSVTIEPFYSE